MANEYTIDQCIRDCIRVMQVEKDALYDFLVRAPYYGKIVERESMEYRHFILCRTIERAKIVLVSRSSD